MTFKEKLFAALSAVTVTAATCTAAKSINDYTELTAKDRIAIDHTLAREQTQRGFVEDLIRASDQFFAQNPNAPTA